MLSRTKIISLSLPIDLLNKLDQAAEELFASRSDYIRQAVVEYLRLQDEQRAHLMAIANSKNPLTEEQIEKMLRNRRLARGLREMLRRTSD